MIILSTPSIFGWQHITYFTIFIISLITLLYVNHKYFNEEKQKTKLLKIVAILLLIAIAANRISLIFKDDFIWNFLPNSYCGLTSLVLSLTVLFGKPHNKIYDCCAYLAIFGGLVTMIYPDFIVQNPSVFYIPTISGLLHHSLHVILSCLLLQSKWLVPSIKKWKYLPIGVSCYVLYGLFLISVFKFPDAMEINKPLLSGTPFYWWFLLIVGSLLHLGVLLTYEYISKNKIKRDAN